jgi:WS/DGAT/MGAT family acyltransferase
MDASFLYMETPSLHMHVVGTLVLDPSNLRGGFSFERMRDLIESRFHVMPGFRQKLRTVPLNIDHPVWVDDPDFDIARHLNHSALPAPGSMPQLAALVGKIASVPLERDRPLWAMWVVEGLEGGHAALVSKIHHATMDGVTGSDLIAHLFDFEPDAPRTRTSRGLAPRPRAQRARGDRLGRRQPGPHSPADRQGDGAHGTLAGEHGVRRGGHRSG